MRELMNEFVKYQNTSTVMENSARSVEVRRELVSGGNKTFQAGLVLGKALLHRVPGPSLRIFCPGSTLTLRSVGLFLRLHGVYRWL